MRSGRRSDAMARLRLSLSVDNRIGESVAPVRSERIGMTAENHDTLEKAAPAGVAPLLATPRDRLKAYLHMLFVDHGFFRVIYLNLHRLSRDAYRSAQPAPHHVRRFARAGLRTVVNLRGAGEIPATLLEKDACARAGVAYREVTLKSRDAPKREAIEAVAALLDEIEYPVVFHCKAGADRAGLMSALYVLLREGGGVAAARRQLSLRYGHVKAGPTGILDAFLDYFEEDQRAAEAAGETLDFMTWVRERYDRYALQRRFKATRWGAWLVDRLLARE